MLWDRAAGANTAPGDHLYVPGEKTTLRVLPNAVPCGLTSGGRRHTLDTSHSPRWRVISFVWMPLFRRRGTPRHERGGSLSHIASRSAQVSDDASVT
ncbi:hypothetical protein AVEN_218577-1 [Araneus ventricosus]|uniref:Uncharacterized protein n=1 Tax=Araneus ventricosus TaxID=182803 RepID=A0A4Y2T516_ARAVE|nr:hypothetical protein AVEN_218577-1 [Araneus ventricosus]